MQCGTCGSQDTTPKQGISKSGKNIGKPWKAYDCNEKECKNDKGYPSRTFVPMGRQALNTPTPVGNSLEKKVDQILAILKANFKVAKTEIAHEEISDLEETPF